MSEISNDSLKKIGKGTLIVLLGTLAGLSFLFLIKIIIARYGTESQYGIFSLALAASSIFAMIATLGLDVGTARYVAYFRGKGETAKIRDTISASIQFPVLASILLCLLLFFTSEIIATKIFNDPGLVLPLRIFAFSIPLLTLIGAFTSIFQGFDRVQENVYFQNMLRNGLFVLLLLPIIFLGLPFIAIFYAYLASLVLCAVAFLLYTFKKLPVKLAIKPSASPVRKELLLFSLPLLGFRALQMVMSYADTLMLGYFKTSDAVGLYNVASPLARVFTNFRFALAFIYTPITTGLYAQNLLPEIRRNYTIVTKWYCSAALPLFLILFLFSDTTLHLLFGANYMPASQALRILSLGFIIGEFLGPNGATLVAIGKTRFLMWASGAATGINVVLNAVLIPQWGIVGASIATAISIVFFCVIKYIKVHTLLKVNPLSKNLLKSAIISIGLIFFISFLVRNFLDVTLWMLPLLLILFYGIYFLVTLFSKSLDQEDIMMLDAIEKRIGVDTTRIRKIVRRFL